MMTAQNSGPSWEGLSPATIDALRSALTAYVAAPFSGDDVRGALRLVSVEARQKSILPEQLLVSLKDIWYALPAVQRLADPADQMRLLQRVVTICIKEYYLTQ